MRRPLRMSSVTTTSCVLSVLAGASPVLADDSLRLIHQPEATAAAAASEQQPVIPPSRVDPAWTVQVEPSMWYVSPSGKIKLPISSGSGPGSFTTGGDEVDVSRLNLDSPRFEPAGELHISSERWRFSFSGSTYGLDRNGTVADSSFRLGSVPVAAGDRLDVSYDFTTVELTGGYRFWGRDFKAASEHPEEAMDLVGRFYGIAGARVYDFSFDMKNLSRSGAPSADTDQFFIEPIIGLRGELDIAEDFTIDVQVSGGGFADSDRSSYSIDVIAGFQWRPTSHVGVQIGYRQLAFGLADGDGAEEFTYDGRLAGLYLGLLLRF